MITVDFSNPPPYVVVVVVSGIKQPNNRTWPFDDEESAVAAYRAAVASGDFTHTMRPATKRLPALIIDLVSLWRRDDAAVDRDGNPTLLYRELDVPPFDCAGCRPTGVKVVGRPADTAMPA